MKHETILYISGPDTNSDSVIGALEAKCHEIVSTDSSTQGAALLYIMHSVSAVVLHQRAERQNLLTASG